MSGIKMRTKHETTTLHPTSPKSKGKKEKKGSGKNHLVWVYFTKLWWWLHHFQGQPVPEPNTLSENKFLPISNLNLSWHNLEPLPHIYSHRISKAKSFICFIADIWRLSTKCHHGQLFSTWKAVFEGGTLSFSFKTHTLKPQSIPVPHRFHRMPPNNSLVAGFPLYP